MYDPIDNRGWVGIGVDHDTAQFAVASIRRWWYRMGRMCYPHAQSLPIAADGGGSNASRNRLWKVERQKLADELGLAIYPTGIAVSDEDLRAVNLVPARFHGKDWNYLIRPRSNNQKAASY